MVVVVVVRGVAEVLQEEAQPHQRLARALAPHDHLGAAVIAMVVMVMVWVVGCMVQSALVMNSI